MIAAFRGLGIAQRGSQDFGCYTLTGTDFSVDVAHPVSLRSPCLPRAGVRSVT